MGYTDMSSHNPKVVHLNSMRTESSKSVLPAQSAILRDLSERGKQRVMTLLYEMFDNTDDALFELADKADNNAEQNLYFESMREVRIQRRGIENRFGQAIDEAFRQLAGTQLVEEAGQPVSLSSVSEDSLSLVEQDELEELVAIDSMISKALSRHPMSLSQLTMRINSLVKVKVEIKNNPLGPAVICHALVESFQRLNVEIKAKLLIFKLFDKYVVSRLEAVLDDANQLLIGAGVLPNLRSDTQSRHSSQMARTSVQPASKGQEPSAQDDEVFTGLQNLLTQSASDSIGRGGGLMPIGQAAPMPRVYVMDLLSELQQQQLQCWQAGDNGWREQLDCLDITGLLDTILVNRQEEQPQSLGKVDDDVINLVQMLFQFILDDRNLAPLMKALIGQLQIPMIKVAMQDKSFFSRGGHPARKLLNEIATAALGWLPVDDEQQFDPLLNKVEEIVSQILNDLDGEISGFQQLLEDFVAFSDLEKRRVGLVERRTVDAEDGRAKSEAARAAVQQIVEEKMAGQCLPGVAVTLLRDAWSNVLFLIYLREGVESEAWQDAVATVDELIWSVEGVERQELLKRVPGLLKKLREGLTQISFDNFAMNKLFSELEAEHLKRFKGKVAPSAMKESTAIRSETSDQSTATTPVTLDQELDASVEAIEQSAYDKVDALSPGTWVEFHPAEASKFRCRLAAIIKPSCKYIFVNRSGKKVAEHSRDGLAADIQKGEITLLDDGLLFDRALESVIGNLRELKGQP